MHTISMHIQIFEKMVVDILTFSIGGILGFFLSMCF